MPGSSPPIRPARRSASGNAALRAEIERVGRMTIEERVKAALTLRDRFDWIKPEAAKTVSTEK
jgi:hypothetical protein